MHEEAGLPMIKIATWAELESGQAYRAKPGSASSSSDEALAIGAEEPAAVPSPGASVGTKARDAAQRGGEAVDGSARDKPSGGP